MARSGALLTEAQWKKITPLLPKPPRQRQGGRPWIENRRVLEGILWILRSGARWQDLPEKFPHPSTCWRRLRDWEERGVWLNIWRTFLSELNERQQLKWSESFLDGSFAPAKKGAAQSEKPSGARGRSGWWWSTAAVFPQNPDNLGTRIKMNVATVQGGQILYSFEFPPEGGLNIWSPDGRAIDYSLTRGGVSDIWRQPLSGGPPKQLTHFPSGL